MAGKFSPEMHEIAPQDVCGGVFVEELGKFVPVDLAETPYHDAEQGITFWEYKDNDGNVRASLLHVPEGRQSPAWHIKKDAGDGDYEEYHRLVAGEAVMVKSERNGQCPTISDTDYQRYLTFTYTFEVDDIDHGAVYVDLDETFEVHARPGAANAAGALVLAAFPGAPFKPEYEERVAPLA